MGVPRAEYQIALAKYPSLAIIATDDRTGEVTAVTVSINGIRGGRGRGSKTNVPYRLFIDVSNIRHDLPGVWVLDPPDSAIRHVNVYHAGMCPMLGREFPHLCWGTYPEQWSSAAPDQRTLIVFMEDVLQHLHHQNFASPAR